MTPVRHERLSLKPQAAAPVPTSMLPTPADSESQVKVLVVDDDPVVLAVVQEWLKSAGYLVSTRGQALGTANWVATEKPAFVLLDVKMPALSGQELALLMRRSHATSGTAIILHSILDTETLAELARTTGAIGAIQKKSSPRLFLAEFERLVVQHRSGASRQKATPTG